MPTLVFDGDCSFCRKRALWLRKHDRNALVIVAWQEADLESLSLTAKECAQAVQWVDGNSHAAGGAAIAKCLTSCNQPWRTAGAVMQWPVVRVLTEFGYRVIAANRRFL